MNTVSNTAAQHLAFIALGIRNNSQDYGDYDRLLDKWNRGEAELIAACMPAAQAIAATYAVVRHVVTPGPRGLVEYDVSEEFGKYVARKIDRCNEMPDAEAQRMVIIGLWLEYIRKAANLNPGIGHIITAVLKEAIPDV